MPPPRELLKIDVHEVSLVDSAANLRVFAVVKQRRLEAPVASFLVQYALTKDKGKIKALSKELALERLAQAVSVIETVKSNMDSYSSMEELWKAMDELHCLLWGAEGDIVTAVLKKALTPDQLAAVADVAAPVEVDVTEEMVSKFVADAVLALKAKAVTPSRLAALSGIVDQLGAAIDEMSSPPAQQTDVAAEVTKALAPIQAALAAVKADLAAGKADLQTQKAAAAATEAQLIASQQQTAALQKQLADLAANTAAPPSDQPTVEPVKKSLWAGSPFSRSRQ